RDRFSNVTSPGLVSRDCFVLGQFRSRIYQHEIAALDWRVLILSRHIMRIGCVRVHRDNHRLLLHPFFLLSTKHELAAVPFSSWFVGANPARNLSERLLYD